ncbi:peptidylprolyl isomerase [Roseovarius sp. TE539]|uniref:peptidylprolyl isomerase n=1 Tax=Roseovarius sp. TE539 TaxID=2249812 RepID=UPI000DDD226D|nr:peptidylprolyl isomerase [Roseovarius sp. TE539]RBI77580.1 peptidylprolyl isomerase [Roseovarius sp. TE539]
MLERLKSLPVTAIAALAFAALPANAQDESTPDADTVVATVDGTDITLGHMIALRSSLPQQYDQLPPEVLFDGILNQLVQQTLLSQSFEGEISRRGQLMLENERRATVSSEILAGVAERAVTEEAVQDAYEAQYANADQKTEYKAAHILVETEEEAASLIEELRDGADFAALAKEHSTGPSSAGGGDLGWFATGTMVAPFEEAVADLEPGTISDPVKTQFGWHVIRLNETRMQETPELGEVRADLEQQIRETAIEAHVAELREPADIDQIGDGEIDPALISQFDLLEN